MREIDRIGNRRRLWGERDGRGMSCGEESRSVCCRARTEGMEQRAGCTCGGGTQRERERERGRKETVAMRSGPVRDLFSCGLSIEYRRGRSDVRIYGSVVDMLQVLGRGRSG